MPFHRRAPFDWQLRSRSLRLGERTLLMAIVNLTPDSFSGDGLLAAGTENAVRHAVAALDGGADIVDLGAESTRPNATPLSADEERRRLLPVLEALRRERPEAVLSIDTYHADTAREAAAAGADIINDVSGGSWDRDMLTTLAASGCGAVLMHARGTPQQWRLLPPLPPGDLLPLVLDGLKSSLAAARQAGIPAEKIVLDPGFGFGKLGAQNLTLLAQMDQLQALERPLLAGLSRKGFLAGLIAPLQAVALQTAWPVASSRDAQAQPASDLAAIVPQISRLHASTAAGVAAIFAGAHILRVHDLQAARESAAIADAVLAALPG